MNRELSYDQQDWQAAKLEKYGPLVDATETWIPVTCPACQGVPAIPQCGRCRGYGTILRELGVPDD